MDSILVCFGDPDRRGDLMFLQQDTFPNYKVGNMIAFIRNDLLHVPNVLIVRADHLSSLIDGNSPLRNAGLFANDIIGLHTSTGHDSIGWELEIRRWIPVVCLNMLVRL